MSQLGYSTSVSKDGQSSEVELTGSASRTDEPSCWSGLVLKSRLVQAYNEEAFHYFLRLERQRCERLGDTFALVLVDVQEQQNGRRRIDSGVARRLLSNLCQAFRETDFVGWYSEQRTAGAVLTGLEVQHIDHSPRLLVDGISDKLRSGLPPAVAGRLRVRLFRNSQS